MMGDTVGEMVISEPARAPASDWCILRMAAGRTLAVADALCAAGIEAWTPREEHSRRVPRSTARRSIVAPVTPTIVFARYDRLGDLLALSKSPQQTYQQWDAERGCMVTHGIPYFTVFRFQDGYPRIADRDLDALRLAEKRGAKQQKVRQFMVGDAVRLPDAGFDGLIGEVEDVAGRYTMVLFPGFTLPIKVEPKHLLAVDKAA